MAGRSTVDVVVIGAGGGGYPAAFLLDAAGRSVVMADPVGNLGGDCLAEGCVPSKAVREASVVAAQARRFGVFGLRGAPPGADWRKVSRQWQPARRTTAGAMATPLPARP